MHHEVVCAVVRPGQLCGTPLQQISVPARGDTVPALQCSRHQSLACVGCAWASPVFLSLVGSGSALLRLLRMTKVGEEGVRCKEQLVLAAWSRDCVCVCCWSELLIYPWARAVVLSSNGEKLFLKTQACHIFYEFRCLNWC